MRAGLVSVTGGNTDWRADGAAPTEEIDTLYAFTDSCKVALLGISYPADILIQICQHYFLIILSFL